MNNKTKPTEPVGHHSIILNDRKSLSLSGVTDIDNFDEKSIKLYTQLGELIIQGRDLRVNELSVESGNLTVEGLVTSIVYTEKSKRKSAVKFAKMFK